MTGLVVGGFAGPALAHVEVSADKTTAGASDVTLSFDGEAENDAAGIASERVVLPDGIEPSAVSLVKAPAGWTFTRTADGFTVAGKALKIGTDAEWKVKVAKLPDGETRLSFKTLETYGNGDVSRWIEIQEPGQAEPDNPAPLVTLKPGAPAASPATSPATSSAVSPAAATPSVTVSSDAPSSGTPSPVAAPGDDGGSSTWWIWVLLVVVLAAGGFYVVRQRSRS